LSGPEALRKSAKEVFGIDFYNEQETIDFISRSQTFPGVLCKHKSDMAWWKEMEAKE
jgi:hypothetical protein